MIIDSSAILAVLQGEPEARNFVRIIHESLTNAISVATLFEASMITLSRRGEVGLEELAGFLARAGVQEIQVSTEQGRLALDAFRRFGRGRHPAALNVGDCFAYALARSRGEALLFKGDDFSATDVMVAA